MRLSEHFTLAEFTKSQTALRKGIYNAPGTSAVKHMKELCAYVLEPIRARHGVTIITSGYRSPQLNAAIGGSAMSQHCQGRAADIECPAVSNLELARWVADELEFDQLILEYHTPGDPLSGWVHVSYHPEANRNMVLTKLATAGRGRYKRGLPG